MSYANIFVEGFLRDNGWLLMCTRAEGESQVGFHTLIHSGFHDDVLNGKPLSEHKKRRAKECPTPQNCELFLYNAILMLFRNHNDKHE